MSAADRPHRYGEVGVLRNPGPEVLDRETSPAGLTSNLAEYAIAVVQLVIISLQFATIAVLAHWCQRTPRVTIPGDQGGDGGDFSLWDFPPAPLQGQARLGPSTD